MDVTALVLAAGSSARMGRPKALLAHGEESFLARIVRVLLAGGAARARVVVGGPHRAEIERAVEELGARSGASGWDAVAAIVNADPALGPVTSVRAGIAAVPATDAYLIHPVDIPGPEPADVAALIACAAADPALDAVVPSVGMRRGHPLLLRAACARRLLAAGSPPTVRDLLRAPGVRLAHVVRENEGLIRDYDAPGDLPRGE